MGEVVGQRPWPMEDPRAWSSLRHRPPFRAQRWPSLALIVVHCFQEKMQRVSRRGAWREGTSEADDFGVSEFRPPPLSYLNLSAPFITMKAGLAIRS